MNEKTIGALAKFTGVSVHTIKYYEKIGLLSSGRLEHSNYRTYDIRVCTDVYECVKYRNMDFSLKETGILLREADDAIQSSMLEKRSEEIAQEIRRLENMKKMVDEYRDQVRIMDARIDKWYIEELPDFYIKKQTRELEYGKDAEIEAEGINLADHIPESGTVVCLSRDYLNGGRQEFSWGIGEFGDSFETDDGAPGIQCVKCGRAFVAYLKFTGPYVTNGEMAEKVREIFSSYANEFPSDAYGLRIKITHDEDGNDWNYMKVFIPLK